MNLELCYPWDAVGHFISLLVLLGFNQSNPNPFGTMETAQAKEIVSNNMKFPQSILGLTVFWWPTFLM